MDKKNAAYVPDTSAEILNQSQSLFTDEYIEELHQVEKHEIVVKICEAIGSCPSNLSIAESIFNSLKYEITNYVLHHEYGISNDVDPDFQLWIESRSNPMSAEMLTEFFSRYIK